MPDEGTVADHGLYVTFWISIIEYRNPRDKARPQKIFAGFGITTTGMPGNMYLGHHLLLIDAPYNVAYVGKTKDALTIENDHMEDKEFLKFLTNACTVANDFMREGAVYYIWHADSEGYNFRTAVKLIAPRA